MKITQIIAALGALAFTGAAGAAPGEDDWLVRSTFYAWIPSISGDATVRNIDVEVDVGTGDSYSELESLAAFMVYTEARKGRWGFYLDFDYASLEFSADHTFQRDTIPGLSLSGGAGLDTTFNLGELGGLYELGRETWGSGAYTAFDALVGARYVDMDVDLSLEITGTVDLPALGLEREGTLAVARSGGIDWIDPMIGLRLRHQFPGGDRIGLRADIGGFGVGSDLTWQLLATYSADFHIGSSTFSGVFGYRLLDIDYSEGQGLNTFAMDVMIHGPVLGLTFRW